MALRMRLRQKSKQKNPPVDRKREALPDEGNFQSTSKWAAPMAVGTMKRLQEILGGAIIAAGRTVRRSPPPKADHHGARYKSPRIPASKNQHFCNMACATPPCLKYNPGLALTTYDCLRYHKSAPNASKPTAFHVFLHLQISAAKPNPIKASLTLNAVIATSSKPKTRYNLSKQKHRF